MKFLLEKYKFYLIFFIILFFGSIYFINPLNLFSKGVDLKNIRTEKAVKGSLSTTVNASGTLEAEEKATLYFLVAGTVKSVNFSEGEAVKKGELIASLDDTEYRKTISKEEADYKSAQSEVEKVLDDIRLYQYGNQNTKGETMTQKNLREEAEMGRDGAFWDLEKARKQLENTKLFAPFDGVVSKIENLTVGQNITASSGSYVTLLTPNNLKFIANVDETEFGFLKVDQKGEVVLDAYPEESFIGEIVKIGQSAVKLSTGGSVVEAELSLPSDLRLLSGLNGEVNFTVTTKENVLIVPQTAVRKNKDEVYVNTLVGSKVQKKIVSLGESLGGKVEILSGLLDQEIVVLGEVR